jgi:hypothetical protein
MSERWPEIPISGMRVRLILAGWGGLGSGWWVVCDDAVLVENSQAREALLAGAEKINRSATSTRPRAAAPGPGAAGADRQGPARPVRQLHHLVAIDADTRLVVADRQFATRQPERLRSRHGRARPGVLNSPWSAGHVTFVHGGRRVLPGRG